MDEEIVQALRREFPELGLQTIEETLHANDNDVAETRRALLTLSSGGASRSRSRLLSEVSSPRGEEDDSWLSWLGLSGGQGSSSGGDGWSLDDISAGLNTIGAQMALGLKQAAHALNQYIPPDLNPFVEEEYYYVEDVPESNEQDKDGTVVVNSKQLTKRAQGTPSAVRTQPTPQVVQEEDFYSDEDVSPTAVKKWE